MIKIRAARAADLDWILGQLPAFSSYYGTKRQLFEDAEHARRTLLDSIERHVLLVAEGVKGLVGFIAGWLVHHPYNPRIRLLAEMFWWVVPEYRRGRAGLLLLREFTAWGKANADWITFAIMDSTNVKHSALEKLGYKPVERAFLLEVN